MKKDRLDPRTVIAVVMVNSLAVVFARRLAPVFFSALLILGFNLFLGTDLGGVFRKCRRLWQVVIFAAVMQSIFIRQGTPLIRIGGIDLMTSYGVERGILILLRLFSIICGAAAISNYSQGELVEALVRIGLSGEFAYMVIIGIKFLPVLMDEMQDSLTAIQLRGIELERLGLGQKMRLYGYLLFPVVSGTVIRARELSDSMEMRGFRACPRRTSMLTLKAGAADYGTAALFIAAELAIMMWR